MTREAGYVLTISRTRTIEMVDNANSSRPVIIKNMIHRFYDKQYRENKSWSIKLSEAEPETCRDENFARFFASIHIVMLRLTLNPDTNRLVCWARGLE